MCDAAVDEVMKVLLKKRQPDALELCGHMGMGTGTGICALHNKKNHLTLDTSQLSLPFTITSDHPWPHWWISVCHFQRIELRKVKHAQGMQRSAFPLSLA